MNANPVREGAINLLDNCVGAKTGEQLLLVVEDAVHGYYDAAAPAAVAAQAEKRGIKVKRYQAPVIDGPQDLPSELITAMQDVDHTVFFSRIGDQIRFTPLAGRTSKTMCYTLDSRLLGSAMGRFPHGLMRRLREKIERRIGEAKTWRLSCPLGTDARGKIEHFRGTGEASGDFSLALFPELIFKPVSCASMDGRVALGRWLMATANNAYEPFQLDLAAPVFARVAQGRITAFEGDAEAVASVKAHYAHVSRLFDIDPWNVHSWHAGIHPKTVYHDRADKNLERWGGVSFGSPRYFHFHTCGDYAPGEISWSLFDVTLTLDGEPLYKDGRLIFFDQPEITALLAEYPNWHEGLEPESDIGID